MKNLLTIITLLSSIFFVSCEKETLPNPTNTTNTTPTTLSVSYKVYSTSGHFNVTFLKAENGMMEEETETMDRTNFTYTFEVQTGSHLMVKAKNSIPSGDEVKVEIWVNGAIFKEGSANAPSAVALAEGNY